MTLRGDAPEKIAILCSGTADDARLRALHEVLMQLGDQASARPHAERAVAITERVFGSDHPEVATALAHLATLLRDGGDAAGARSLLERAVVIKEKKLGLDHPLLVITLTDLAIVLNDLGDVAGARVLLERALAIAEQHFGQDHPRTRSCHGWLAALGPLPLSP